MEGEGKLLERLGGSSMGGSPLVSPGNPPGDSAGK